MVKNSTKQRVQPFSPEPVGIPDPHGGLRSQPSSSFGGGRSGSPFGGAQPTSGKLPGQEPDGDLHPAPADSYGQYGDSTKADWS
jgi:hypothetical protein